jgi:TolA-binding protein
MTAVSNSELAESSMLSSVVDSTMNKAGIGILVALLLTGNIATVALLLRERSTVREPTDGTAREGAAAPELGEAIANLSAKVDLLAESARRAPRGVENGEPAAPAKSDDGVLPRLVAIEKLLAEMRSADAELTAAKLREERENRLQGDDGYVAADELLSEKSYALAGNAYLKFLEHHPDHPDARDLMQKARDAFRSAGYTEKAFWVHQEMMKRFPESGGADLMSLAEMEKDARRLDDAIQHAGEAAEAARIEEDKVWRLLYRAWFVQLRDGDEAGIQAYREVERLAEVLGMGAKNPGKKVKEKIAELEARLAQGR